MGKISQFNRRQFVSSFVGGATADRSAEIIAGGIEAAVSPIIKQQAAALRETELIAIDQQANNAHIKFALVYQDQAKILQEQHSDNPNAYPEAAAQMGQKLQEEMAAEISDVRVRSRFSKAANTSVRQSSQSAFKWTVDKQEENALTALNDSIETAILSMSNSEAPDGLAFNLGALGSTIFGVKTPKTLSSSKKIEIFNKAAARGTKEHLMARAGADPTQTLADLNAGVYDNIEVEFPTEKGFSSIRVPLTAEVKNQAKRAAKKAEKALATAAKKLKTTQKAKDLAQFQAGVQAGDVSISDMYKEFAREDTFLKAVDLSAAIDYVQDKDVAAFISDGEAMKDIALNIGSLTQEEIKEKIDASKLSYTDRHNLNQAVAAHFSDPRGGVWRSAFSAAANILTVSGLSMFQGSAGSGKHISEMLSSFLDISLKDPDAIKNMTDNSQAIFKEQVLKSNGRAGTTSTRGQLMIDANGNKALVFPDGTVEEVR